MQTPTHTIIALALLAKNGQPIRNRAIIIGSLIPDLFIYICWIWLTGHGVSQSKIWNEIYFQDGVQFWSGVSNSVPIYASLAMLGWVNRKKRLGQLTLVFALAALTHIAGDFPFHAEDAHQHFWPFTHWKFHSPLSYWDPSHYGNVVSTLEALFALCCVTVLLKRLTGKWTQVTLKIIFAAYILILILRPLFWVGVF